MRVVKQAQSNFGQTKRFLPFGNRRGNEIRLSKTGKVSEHESAGDPTEGAPYEFNYGFAI